MNNGIINGELAKFNETQRAEVVNYIDSLNIDRDKKNKFFAYWKKSIAEEKKRVINKQNKKLWKLNK